MTSVQIGIFLLNVHNQSYQNMGDTQRPWNWGHFQQNTNSSWSGETEVKCWKVSHFILPDHLQEVNRITHETHTNHYLLNFLIYKVHLHEVRINS